MIWEVSIGTAAECYVESCLSAVVEYFCLGIMSMKHGDEAGEEGISTWRMEYEILGVGGIASRSTPSYIHAFLTFTYTSCSRPC